MSRSLPICEAIAADSKHYLFRAKLERLKQATAYQDQHLSLYGVQGHLDGLAEAEAITWAQWRDAQDETRAFLWGAEQ